jgi:AcrR family transcriptional regulator
MAVVAVEPSTRERLIEAATDVFATHGYEGTRLQDVARAAGLTTGAVYSNFRNKGELLFEAIGTRSATEIDDLLRTVHGATLPAALRDLGRRIVERDARALLLDAIVAARRDPDLADHLRERSQERETWLADVVREAQSEGALDRGVDPGALARLCTTIALGSLVIRALDLPMTDPDAWGDVIDRLVDSVAPRSEHEAASARGPAIPARSEPWPEPPGAEGATSGEQGASE